MGQGDFVSDFNQSDLRKGGNSVAKIQFTKRSGPWLAVCLLSLSGSLRAHELRLSPIRQVEAETDARIQQATGDYLDLDGSKIYYEQCGSGPTIVLLHDGLVHAVTWDGVWDSLCGKLHVVRYDRRGYGRSDSPKASFSPVDDLYKLVQAVLQTAT
jgi:hypothetical protein